ncbi:sensor histidine kinase [Nonomuraea endophytica]|uniref:Two-component system sensor histidine kinase DesK n=1 Tax=Nonomuraea endophytica TaxID=714136 RepID=A0A7W8EHW0_9ACTN|nr:histidine kinase [Nonomuraea endophytica]MBB5079928.1 two-component system sensor histidine kinase DesK [Nonomuraea endophytica]
MDELTRARRMTRLVLNSTLGAMWLVILLNSAATMGTGRTEPWQIGPALLMAVAFSWFYLRISKAVFERRYPVRDVVVSGVLAFAACALSGADVVGWGFVPMAWLSVAVVGVRRRTMFLQIFGSWVVVTALAAFWTVAGRAVFVPEDTPVLVGITVAAFTYLLICLLTPLANRMWVWIWLLAAKAHEAKEAQSRLAVAEERLRFARDLHDLVGHQLSALAVKSELAVRLADADVGAAKAEMAEVRDLTRKALRELREAVRGYRELDLPAELLSVRSVLEAAGVRCELNLPYREVPADVAQVFAYVVREAVTNVLKHSTAAFCVITLRFTGDDASLEVRNDGVARRRAVDLGSGLSGLNERLAAVGGKLTALPNGDGEFTLKAVVPR